MLVLCCLCAIIVSGKSVRTALFLDQTDKNNQKENKMDKVIRKPQRYLFKLDDKLLEHNQWNLTLPLSQAIDEIPESIIALGDSQLFRFVDELTNNHTTERATDLIKQIKSLSHRLVNFQSDGTEEAEQVKKTMTHKLAIARKNLIRVSFVPDLVQVHFSVKANYDKVYRSGFTVNGIKFRELYGTAGGIKKGVILYVNEELYADLTERINAGRNQKVEMIPAKLQAYMALTSSNDLVLNLKPRILVVHDVITNYKAEVLRLHEEEGKSEPVIEHLTDADMELNACDGCSIMTPEFARKVNMALNGIDEPISGICVRGIPFVKGMLFPFDFVEFAEKVAGTYQIRDYYGDLRDVRDYDVILTESMFKLASAYTSTDEYMKYVEKYHYDFSVSKVAPLINDIQRTTNYQFLQSYELTDEEIKQLVSPTTENIKDILSFNPYKAMLFLLGTQLKEGMTLDDKRLDNTLLKALMLNPEKMINDPCIRSMLYRQIKKRINDAKIGVLDIHGHFSIIGGDLYGLCQNMFGLEVTGLLKAEEVYNHTWHEQGTEAIMCFRAPMSVHNNIRKLNISYSPDANYWFRHIKTCTILNSWDTTYQSLNGMDNDRLN